MSWLYPKLRTEEKREQLQEKYYKAVGALGRKSLLEVFENVGTQGQIMSRFKLMGLNKNARGFPEEHFLPIRKLLELENTTISQEISG